MFRTVHNQVWAFDAEWVPDADGGRRLYGLSSELSEHEVFEQMWKEGGATEAEPRPYLKTVMCRIASISTVIRKVKEDGSVVVQLASLPKDPHDQSQLREENILERYLNAIGKEKPQLIGYNSYSADLKIFIQRAVVKGVSAKEFTTRPNKPWEGVDYFLFRDNPQSIDLFEILGGAFRMGPSLNQLAILSGIPGKIGLSGYDVAQLWLEGRVKEIVHYNEWDALSTYLLWLRVAHFGGFFDKEQYLVEQQRVRTLLENEALTQPHLGLYLEEWKRVGV